MDHNIKGFTILEVVISAAILGVVVIALLNVFDSGNKLYSSSVKVMDVMQVVRKPMNEILKEVRQSKAEDIAITNSGAKIDFIVPLNINPVTYSQSISYYLDQNNQLIREHPPGVTSIVARNIASLNFSLTSNRLDVALQAQANLKHSTLVLPVSETVTLRN